jgi:hypothetical protein
MLPVASKNRGKSRDIADVVETVTILDCESIAPELAFALFAAERPHPVKNALANNKAPKSK